MPVWHEFYQKHKGNSFEILSVAVDLRGAEVVKEYTEGQEFTTVIDSENLLANYFGFKIVPNGIFIDEEGTIRLVKEGFHVDNEEHTSAIESLIKGEAETVELKDTYYNHQNKNSMEIQLSQTKFKLAQEYTKSNRKEEALKELDEALALDPENFLIRKQRWYIRHPEKFSPTIDIEWQQEQLKKEKELEAKQNMDDCGPDGCKIPGT